MILNNYQIFQYSQNCYGLFEEEDLYIPAKANFLIQKNLHTIATAAIEIETERIKIAKHYGELNESGEQYLIPPEKVEIANNEINDLFAIEQDLPIYTISIDSLGDTQLTPKQMQALMFMIED